MSTAKDSSASRRLVDSELGLLISGQSLGTRRTGKKPGGSTQTAFAGLAHIARNNDALLNEAIGKALVENALIEDFETEKDLGTDLNFFSDICATRDGDPIRIEVMWRGKVGRAGIANYVLGKLRNYSKAIGLLE